MLGAGALGLTIAYRLAQCGDDVVLIEREPLPGGLASGFEIEPGVWLDRFYHQATDVLLAREAVIDKFVGDEVVALFIPALAGADHARHAVEAARDLLRVTGHHDAGGPWLPLGVGVHSGTAYVGVVGDAVTDFTALGDTVNVTARLASVAAAGEILVSAETARRAELDDTSETRTLDLRGRSQSLDVRVLHI